MDKKATECNASENNVKWEKVNRKNQNTQAGTKEVNAPEKAADNEAKYKIIISCLLGLIILLMALFLGNRYLLKKSDSEVSVYNEIAKTADSKTQENISNQDSELKVNINTANKFQLMELEGIGEKKAESIIEYRKIHGDFKSTDEITKVDGIGEKIYKNIINKICVSD